MLEAEINRIFNILDLVVHPFVRVLVAVTVTVIFLYFFLGWAGYIKKDEGKSEGVKRGLVWGVLGVFVLVSVWGILYFLQRSFFGTNAFSKPDVEFRRATLPE